MAPVKRGKPCGGKERRAIILAAETSTALEADGLGERDGRGKSGNNGNRKRRMASGNASGKQGNP
jgi:hypothetical protein